MNNIEDKYNLYDRIISSTYANIVNSILIKGEDGVFSVGKDVIFSKPQNKNDYAQRVFQQVGFMVAEMFDRKIAIEMNPLNFLYYKIVKKNKNLRWKKRREMATVPVGEIAPFEAEAFNQELSIFKEIWETYYKRNKNVRNLH